MPINIGTINYCSGSLMVFTTPTATVGANPARDIICFCLVLFTSGHPRIQMSKRFTLL